MLSNTREMEQDPQSEGQIHLNPGSLSQDPVTTLTSRLGTHAAEPNAIHLDHARCDPSKPKGAPGDGNRKSNDGG